MCGDCGGCGVHLKSPHFVVICSVSVLMSHSIDFGGERVVGEQVLQMSHNTSQ